METKENISAATAEEFKKGMGIRSKLILWILVLLLSLAAAIAAVVVLLVPPAISEQVREKGSVIASGSAGQSILPLISGNFLQFEALMRTVRELPGVRYVIIEDATGKVLSTTLDNKADIDKVKANLAAGLNEGAGGEAIEVSQAPITVPAGMQMPEGFTPPAGSAMPTPGQTLGNVIVGMDGTAAGQTVRSNLLQILTVFAVVAALSMIAALLFSRALVGPLERLTTSAEAISLGRLDDPVELPRRMFHDEITDLGDSVERMRLSMASAISRLRRR